MGLFFIPPAWRSHARHLKAVGGVLERAGPAEVAVTLPTLTGSRMDA